LSWLWSRRHNRRFARKHVLDVKLRASQRKRNRVRRAASALVILTVTGTVLFLAWRGGQELVRRFMTENPAFAIHRLDVQTDGVMAIEQIRRWAGVKLEDNLWALDLTRVKRDLELVPAIESASVERVLPNTLRILVTEREPVAQVRLPPLPGAPTNREPMTYQIDAHGFVMFPLEAYQLSTPAHTNPPLPLLTGISAMELRAGRRLESGPVRAALQLLVDFDRSPMFGLVDLKQIEVGQPGMLQVVTGQQTEVTLGLADLGAQLQRWRAIHLHGQKTARHLAWLDLSVANNVPARWSEALPQDIPPPVKSARYKKKHV
jgi:cell division septal protein FtsQ